ncbi:DUF3558 domain-containing protein [Streptomyces sp. A1136]|uniref:DUF3558 domain-containing protein n=1 Tax=Streptomyces sp. A1136 TaxID=2563102 RepID=UPI001F0D16FC|nr:DUF3558 domain-containing protein [Streptomyces sp. A1136]
MQRKAVRRRALPGVAMLTALVAGVTGLTGCTETSSPGTTTDAKAGGSTVAPAQPGKYRNLPAPCKAVDAKRLRVMLPADESLTNQQREQLYAGTADASYDADRRVGCRWTAQTPSETRLLSVGFERVVSYDRATASDDDKARQVYVRRLTDAHLPFPGATATPSPPVASASTGGAPAAPPSPTGSPGGSPTGSPGAGPGAGPGPTAAPELGSRVLEGLGNEAYIEDKLSPAGTTAPQSRTVRTVFRTSNVIVTIEYSVQPSQPGVVPSSVETQDRVRQLAQALVERFND